VGSPTGSPTTRAEQVSASRFGVLPVVGSVSATTSAAATRLGFGNGWHHKATLHCEVSLRQVD
jgi:hypothetical protein